MMKIITKSIISATIFLVILHSPISNLKSLRVFAQSNEHIETFDISAEINTDGTIDIIETIVYDFGALERHAIFRSIPYIYVNDQDKKYQFEIYNVSVSDENDSSYEVKESREDDEMNLRIGDPNITISGLHTYKISYSLKGALLYFSDHDEFFWNATGTQWDIPISKAQATVILPTNQLYSDIPLKCFTGSFGSTEQNCEIRQENEKITFTAENLNAYQGLTIVTGFSKGIVAEVPAEKAIAFQETLLGKILLMLLGLVGFFWYIVYPMWIPVKWYRYGRDPHVGYPPTAYFDPPQTKKGRALTPAETGTLIDETVHLRDVLATVVDLARRGHIIIDEKKKNDFWLKKSDKGLKIERIDQLPNFEVKLLTDIFPSKSEAEVHLKDASLLTTVAEVEKMIYEGMVNQNFFPRNPHATRTFYNIIGSIAVISFNIQLALVSLIFGRNMPKKTLLGAQEANKAKGLYSFLKSQERQLAFEAEKNPEFQDKQVLFEKFLPYAIAFGVEKVWMKRFKDINLKQPDWYTSYRSGSFTPALMLDNMQSSFKSFNSAATPTRSSTGHSSGFSGGGFSGGGGGGGGGGSW